MPSAVPTEVDRPRTGWSVSASDTFMSGTPFSCAISIGLMLKPRSRLESWLTSEFAREVRPMNGRSSSFVSVSSGEGVHDSLMSSVKSERMEKREERVPPVDTSLMRLYPLKLEDDDLNGSGVRGEEASGSEEGAN